MGPVQRASAAAHPCANLRPLKVGLNLLHLVPGETGGSEVYARHLVPALLEAGEADLVVFASREGAPALRGEPWAGELEVVEIPVTAVSRVRRVLAEQTLLPRSARRTRIDLLHNLFTTAPAAPGVPQVTTILDLIYRRFPQAHTGLRSLAMRMLVPLSARRSARIIAISEATKSEVVSHLGVDESHVDVTYLAPGLSAAVDPVPEATLRERHSLGESPIVLSVSAHRPHKNIERLVDAVSALERPAVLVVPGYGTEWEDELAAHVRRRGAEERVRLIGWLGDAELEGFYEAATCLAFPSLAEGFGLPVLEAMARGLPVACSSATSLPEVAGDAALYFDPLDVPAMTGAIDRLLADPDLRERLAAAGREHAAGFTWRRTAEGTLRSYERALAS
jgi:glycosyltransferase involved in cell wall biosynthesis